jgi:predicted nucleic acid-binding protein
VTRYLLDTNSISETTKPNLAKTLADWLAVRADSDHFVSTLTVAEIWRGIAQMAVGRRRFELESWFAGPAGPQQFFGERVLPFDYAAALEWGFIMADARRTGRARSPIDMIIAATALANDCAVVTANERHFDGVVEFLNPLRPPS